MNTASHAIPELPESSQLAFISRLFEHLPNHVYYKNSSFEYIWANNAHLNSLNLQSIDQLYGKRDSDFYSSDSTRLALEDEKSVIETGKPIINKACLMPTFNSQDKWVCSTIVPVYDHQGKVVIGILITLDDLSSANEAIISDKELMDTLLNHSQDSIYFKDRESKFIRACRQHADKIGVKNPDTLIGKTDFDYLPETQAKAAYNIEQEVIQSGAPLLGKINKEIHTDGCTTWVQKSTIPLKDQNGNIIGTLNICKDITSQKEAETELDATTQKLLAISKHADMSEVANNILHNVGNVLNSVNIAASTATTIVKSLRIQSIEKTATLLDQHLDTPEFLSKHEKGKQVPNFLHQLAGKLNSDQETAISELNSMTDYINHIKEVLNMQQTNFKNSDISEKIKASRLIEKAVDINRGSLTRHEIKVSIDIINDIEIRIDKHKTLQILVNLIRNAKQACDDSNQREKKVNISTNNHDDDHIYIDVADNGIGITSENLTKIFEHGFTTKKDGNGFGLHSCQSLAKELGGNLSAHSDGKGEGSTFTLVLPKNPPEI